MSSSPMNRFRTGKSAAIFLSVAAALLMGNAQVRSDLIATVLFRRVESAVRATHRVDAHRGAAISARGHDGRERTAHDR